jgi:hypothetical protein
MIMGSVSFSQTTTNEAKKEINKKAMKLARKEAKRLMKDGWETDPGSLPLAKMLETYYLNSYLVNEDGSKKFIEASPNEKDRIKQNAYEEALQSAGFEIAQKTQQMVNAYVEGNAAKADLSQDQITSIREYLKNSITLIQADLGYMEPYVKISRMSNNGSDYEVQLKVLYDSKQALKKAEEVVVKGLKEKLNINDGRLRKIIGISEK